MTVKCLSVFLAALALCLSAGCGSPALRGDDGDGVTLGEGHVEPIPATASSDTKKDGKISVDPTLTRREKELAAREAERNRRMQAEAMKRYEAVHKQADHMISQERQWLAIRLAAADEKLAAGNLTEAEKILKEILARIPHQKSASKRMLEIEARRRKASESEQTLEERVTELVEHARNLRTEGVYDASLDMYLEAGKLLAGEPEGGTSVRLGPEIKRSIKELRDLISERKTAPSKPGEEKKKPASSGQR